MFTEFISNQNKGIRCVFGYGTQLNILRELKIMSFNSKRYGMITIKDAKRLVNSFLAEDKALGTNKTLQDLSFEVEHICGSGSEGIFYASLYTNNRAKCISCLFCDELLTPNKFVLHTHERPDKQHFPLEAISLNSWRSFIKLKNEPELSQKLLDAWENVKAIFSGGKRRRKPEMPSVSPKRMRNEPLSDQNSLENADISEPHQFEVNQEDIVELNESSSSDSFAPLYSNQIAKMRLRLEASPAIPNILNLFSDSSYLMEKALSQQIDQDKYEFYHDFYHEQQKDLSIQHSIQELV